MLVGCAVMLALGILVLINYSYMSSYKSASNRQHATQSAHHTSTPVDSAIVKIRSRLAFNAPKRMEMGKTETIHLHFSPTESKKKLKQKLSEEGAKGPIDSAENIPTAYRMQARLTGKDFKIEAEDHETQAVLGPTAGKETSWEWQVTPTSWGKKNLHLTVAAVFRIPGESVSGYHTVTSYDRSIVVDVTMGQRLVSYATAIPSAITTGVVLGILGVIGTALLGWWGRMRTRSRSASGNDHPPTHRDPPAWLWRIYMIERQR